MESGADLAAVSPWRAGYWSSWLSIPEEEPYRELEAQAGASSGADASADAPAVDWREGRERNSAGARAIEAGPDGPRSERAAPPPSARARTASALLESAPNAPASSSLEESTSTKAAAATT